MYPTKIPSIIKRIYSSYTWDVKGDDHSVYLTFDDGPHPEVTLFVLDELAKYNAKATFFCIGKNVEEYPDVYSRILVEGHRTGNHTHNHLNGWKTPDKEYISNVAKAREYIDSDLFRPPYGRITSFQANALMGNDREKGVHFRIIMWDVLSGDFDLQKNGEDCVKTVLKKSKPGSIITFHDSEKAFPRLRIALPIVLQEFAAKSFQFKTIE